MLVLQRRIGEMIVIGGDIRVTVTAARCNQVRLGIEAPLDVTVDRAEVAARREGFAHAAPMRAE